MKRIVSLCLLCAVLFLSIPALGATQTYNYTDSTFYGMLYEGKPSGFGALWKNDQTSVSYGVRRNGQWVSPVFKLETSKSGRATALMVVQYVDGVRVSSIRYKNDRNEMFWYEDNVVTECVLMTSNGKLTRYLYNKNGKITGQRSVSASYVKGTLMQYGFLAFRGQTYDDRISYYASNSKSLLMGPVLTVYNNGNIYMNTGYNGIDDTYYYIADKDYYQKGTRVNNKWLNDRVNCYADGTEKPNPPVNTDGRAADGQNAA